MTTTTNASSTDSIDGGGEPGRRVVRAAIWLPGLAVAIGAAVATAHGLYEVALASRVPTAIAWLYPLITDGLALVAYAATARLSGSAARYAWAVVVLAAGLSGLAQAMYLASDPAPVPPGAPAPAGGEVAGRVFVASAVLRFGVGAWPAVAAAIVAHLLYLLATDTDVEAAGDPAPRSVAAPAPSAEVGVQPASFSPPVQPERPTVQPVTGRSVQSDPPSVQQRPEVARPADRPALAPAPAEQPSLRSGGTPARDRARAAATRHAHRHGALPTVSELETAAAVSRGTAAAALKTLRDQPTPLHLITTSSHGPAEQDDPSIEEHAQP